MSVIHIHNNGEYESQLGEKDKLIVVDFSAEWCGPCKRIAPKYKELAEANPGASFLHVDIDECGDIPITKTVQGVPTFMFYKNGELLEQFAGANTTNLENTVAKYA